jgi:hypothetical protein
MWGVGVLSSGESDYGHVLSLVLAKLRFGGALPEDPDALPFGAQLLWQGAFSTGSVRDLVWRLGPVGLLLPLAVLRWLPGWWRGRGDDRTLLLAAFGVAVIASALLIRRTNVLYGLVAPVAAVLLLDGERRRLALAATLAVLAVQGLAFGRVMSSYSTHQWYPPAHIVELANHVEWIRENLGGEGAVAAEFQLSTAILWPTRTTPWCSSRSTRRGAAGSGSRPSSTPSTALRPRTSTATSRPTWTPATSPSTCR